MEKYICPVCGEDWLPEAEDPKYKGMCIGCEAEIFCKDLEAKWNKELSIYKKRTGIEYDFDSFYYACQRGDINKSDLNRLPELKDVYEGAIIDLKESESIGYDPQMTLNFDNDDLPF